MKYFLVIAGVVVAAAALITFYVRFRARAEIEYFEPSAPAMTPVEVNVGGETLELVPEEASNSRIAQTGLPTTASEDRSELLKVPARAQGQQRRNPNKDRDYRPDETVEFVVDVEFDGAPVFTAKEVEQAFGPQWSQAHGHACMFGWSPEIRLWSYLIAADAPKTFTKLCIGIPLYDPLAEMPVPLKSTTLHGYVKSIDDRTKRLGRATIRLNQPVESAEKASKRIGEMVASCNRDVTVRLLAPSGAIFPGREIWDVMLCLKLPWGDMDLFHWPNQSAIGDSYFFSVSTSTPPGYFLPERIARNQVKVSDLVFSFSIPRSAGPLEVFESMLKAVEFTQSRLGGEIADSHGNPLRKDAVRAEIKDVIERMKQAGFEPGANGTLRVF